MSVAEGPRLTPGRLEAFSDGVFSIAATLLVLDLRVPDVTNDLAAALVSQWPNYVTYVVSFLTIGIIWVNHHSLFANVRHVDRTLLFVNMLLLLTVSAIPFPTALLAHYVVIDGASHIAAAVYGGVMVAMSVAFTLLWRHVTRDARLLGRHLDPRRARQESALFSVGLIGYILGAAVSFVSAGLALLVYGLIAVFYIFPWLPEATPVTPADHPVS
jgi:uncharacterized membrane protein